MFLISGTSRRQCRDEAESGGGRESREASRGLPVSPEWSSPAFSAEHQTQDGLQQF